MANNYKQCSLCKARVHFQDLYSIETPRGATISNVCDTCVDRLSGAMAKEVGLIRKEVELAKFKKAAKKIGINND